MAAPRPEPGPELGATTPTAPEPDARAELGRRGEDLAARFLLARGFSVVDRNWRPSASTCGREVVGRLKMRGELDIVAWEGKPWRGPLCFVEVKSRSSSEWGTPGQAVNASKQRQIVRLAQAYLLLHGAREPRFEDVSCRFDVVEVWLGEGQVPRIALHKAAFDASAAPRREF